MKLKEYDRLDGQVALVTGANSGIGKSIAIHLAREGASVVVNYYVDPDAAQAVVDQIKNEGGEAMAVQADVSKEDDIKIMFKKLLDKYNSLDILVNNAGIQRDSPITEMSLDDWNRVISTNLTGQFLCAREAAKVFMKQGVREGISIAAGKIICISSVHEVIPWAGHVNYAASKGGVNLMMQTMAQELAPHKIRVNSIGPGAIKTPINTNAWDTPEAEKDLLKLIPYKRVGVPEDVGRLAVFLAADESDYITGTTVFIDGGMTLYPGFATGG